MAGATNRCPRMAMGGVWRSPRTSCAAIPIAVECGFVEGAWCEAGGMIVM